ncbi:hypothetical protein EJ08DRAFT_662045 [Tothia fuscella]|uniref:Uncharacterized protein n=1 Tax=Tothia fuscella TaxID=1048955 RepID=A0A9P4NNH3_9PEZI|nr:hypothetical protein EJ08DRAFT_662045 [Tothia fuscella]
MNWTNELVEPKMGLSLQLDKASFSSNGVIGRLPRLESLSLSAPQYNSTAVVGLDVNHNFLRKLSLHNINIWNSGLSPNPGFSNVTELKLVSSYNREQEDPNQLFDTMRGFPSLQKVHVEINHLNPDLMLCSMLRDLRLSATLYVDFVTIHNPLRDPGAPICFLKELVFRVRNVQDCTKLYATLHGMKEHIQKGAWPNLQLVCIGLEADLVGMGRVPWDGYVQKTPAGMEDAASFFKSYPSIHFDYSDVTTTGHSWMFSKFGKKTYWGHDTPLITANELTSYLQGKEVESMDELLKLLPGKVFQDQQEQFEKEVKQLFDENPQLFKIHWASRNMWLHY